MPDDAKPKRARTKGRAVVESKAEALSTLTVEYIDVSAVKPNAYNPNRQSEHDFDLLKRSIDEDGFTQPVVAIRINPTHRSDAKFAHYQDGDVVIVDGEHRWRAASDLGYAQIPVVIVPMGVEQMRIATLRHNRARGSEDYDLSAAVLRDLQELGAIGWATDSLQITDTELEAILSDIPAPDALAGLEFGEAWVPDSDARSEGEYRPDHTSATTPDAVAAVRRAEVAAAEAHTEEERIQAKKEANIYRIVLTFSGDEGRIVRTVLGEQPAVKLVELCRRAAAE